jgi:probable rRNA maturation factor
VVDDAAMRRLHQRYLGARRTTDVLAFDLAGPGPAAPLGEVIVSADQAARQAARLRIPLGLELDLLLVHGILHLVGYDDHDPREARLMHARAREILSGPAAAGRRSPDRLWTGLLDGR